MGKKITVVQDPFDYDRAAIYLDGELKGVHSYLTWWEFANSTGCNHSSLIAAEEWIGDNKEINDGDIEWPDKLMDVDTERES